MAEKINYRQYYIVKDERQHLHLKYLKHTKKHTNTEHLHCNKKPTHTMYPCKLFNVCDRF